MASIKSRDIIRVGRNNIASLSGISWAADRIKRTAFFPGGSQSLTVYACLCGIALSNRWQVGSAAFVWMKEKFAARTGRQSQPLG
jgi:hypothetical protein